MKELAVLEKYIYGLLSSIGATYGIPVRNAPFDMKKPSGDDATANPTIYYRYHAGIDLNGVGPGPRLMTTAIYEIGVYHNKTTFGGLLCGTLGKVELVDLLEEIDQAFQDYSTPTNQSDGVVYSCERQSAVRLPDTADVVYRRDGGLYKFHVTKTGSI